MTDKTELNENSELNGRTIGRANARLITPEEANAVVGALYIPSSIRGCLCIGGRDYLEADA
jgi:hypothetical protein